MAETRKPAHQKKNSTAAGKFKERKAARNAAAPKQRWVVDAAAAVDAEGNIVTPGQGHWER